MPSKMPAIRSESALFIWQPKVVMWYCLGEGGMGRNERGTVFYFIGFGRMSQKIPSNFNRWGCLKLNQLMSQGFREE